MAFPRASWGHRPSEADDSVALDHLSSPPFDPQADYGLQGERKLTCKCNKMLCCFNLFVLSCFVWKHRLLAPAASTMTLRKAQQVTWLSSCVVLLLYCSLLAACLLFIVFGLAPCVLRLYTCCNCLVLDRPERSGRRSRVVASSSQLHLPGKLLGRRFNSTLLGFC